MTKLICQLLCVTVVQWSRSCLHVQINRVRLPVTPFPVSFYRFFFCLVSLFNTISPLGVFFCILTADPAVHALRSIYILSLSSEFYFGKGLSLVFYDNRNLKISKSKKSEQYISLIKSKFLSVSSMNTMLAILKVTDARRDIILAGRLYRTVSRESQTLTNNSEFEHQ